MGEAGARSPFCQNPGHSEEPSLPWRLRRAGGAGTRQLPPNLPEAAETQTPKGQRAGKQPGDTQSWKQGHLVSHASSVSPALCTNSSVTISALPRSGQESWDLTCLRG